VPIVYFLAASFVLGAVPLEALIEEWPLVFTSYLPEVLMVFLIVSLREEIGWMGFALPRLQDRYGPLLASAVLGALWALWHLPAYFGSTQIVADKVGLGDLDRLLYLLPLLILLAIFTRIVMSWLFQVAMGSVVVTLFHAAFNISNNELIRSFVPEINRMFPNNGWLYIVLGALALLLVVITGGVCRTNRTVPKHQGRAYLRNVERRVSDPNTPSR
jgi:membrane protease YdiL (CAAX protease family)